MKQRTLSIIKPDAVKAGYIGDILSRFQKEGLHVVAMRMTQLSQTQAEGFYAVHRERPFFGELVEFMTSGPIVAITLEADDAIQGYRTLMGATDPAKADEGTLRKLYASNVQNNAVHGSDSPENAQIEIAYFFSALDLVG